MKNLITLTLFSILLIGCSPAPPKPAAPVEPQPDSEKALRDLLGTTNPPPPRPAEPVKPKPDSEKALRDSLGTTRPPPPKRK